MAVSTGSNRRRFHRLDTDFPALVEGAGNRFEGRIQNITQDGCQLEGPVPARVGEQFAIAFGNPGAITHFRARVTWTRPSGTAFRFGCGFWAMDEEGRRRLLTQLIRFASLNRPAAKAETPAPGEEAPPDPA